MISILSKNILTQCIKKIMEIEHDSMKNPYKLTNEKIFVLE